MPEGRGGGIFVSYRRHESSHLAGRLYDRLADRFGEGQVFIDVDAIEPGVDFAEEISRAVATCKVLLAVIGPNWLTATDERGRRRLDDPGDIVRLEIEVALSRDVRVIPILIEGAVMPGRQDLPESLGGLARRNALFIRHESFRSDVGRLVTAIERVLAPAPGMGTVYQSQSTSKVPQTHNVQPDRNALAEVANEVPESVQGDLGRAARLIADAERIAQLIPDESSKASALASVAAVLAVTDPGRAAQVIAEAQRIAQSVPDGRPLKPSALRDVAKALAATDPDRAARLIGQSIPDGEAKASALASVAKALAATDPGRAAQLSADAERMAQSIPDGYSKPSALADVAKALAATDPDRAARLFADAERIAQSIPDEVWKTSALADVAKALAATDPHRAYRIAQSVTDRFSKAMVLVSVAEGLAAIDPDSAARVIDFVERIAQPITDEVLKASVLASVAKALAPTDPDRAERIARSITPKNWEAWALMQIAEVVSHVAATSA